MFSVSQRASTDDTWTIATWVFEAKNKRLVKVSITPLIFFSSSCSSRIYSNNTVSDGAIGQFYIVGEWPTRTVRRQSHSWGMFIMKIVLFLTSIRIYFPNWKLRTHCLNDGSVPMILFVCGCRNMLYFYLLFHHICTVVNSGHSTGL